MLTDADGLVLNRMSGDNTLLRALDAVHLAPGFAYAERTVGTNGLGLAIADRVPTVVRAEEHYALSLCTYTCAAVPVLDPLSGQLEGCVNLTTWSSQSSDLLLALAQSAASNTSAMMLARSRGQKPRAAQRGEVFRVETPRLEPGSGTIDHPRSRPGPTSWRGPAPSIRDEPHRSPPSARKDPVGRPCSHRRCASSSPASASWPPRRPRPRTARPGSACGPPSSASPTPASSSATSTSSPSWVAEHMRDLVVQARVRARTGEHVPFAMTASRYEAIPPALAPLVDTIVAVPPLRERPEDVMPSRPPRRSPGTRTRGRPSPRR